MVKAKSANNPTPGEYRLTEEDVAVIGDLLLGGGCIMLDPCCGNAMVASTIAHDAGIDVLGFEKDDRVVKAPREDTKDKTVVIYEDFFDVDIKGKPFGAVYLNPPINGNGIQRRFLEKATILMPFDGVLVLVLPKDGFDEGITAHLASWYKDVVVFKAAGSPGIMILLGVKKRYRETDGSMIAGLLKKPGSYDKRDRDLEFIIPKTVSSIDLIQMSVKGPDPAVMKARLDTFDEDWKKLQALVPAPFNAKRPLMALRKGHLAQLISSGILDGELIDPDNGRKYLIKGTVKKAKDVIEDTETFKKSVFRDVITILKMDQRGRIEAVV